MDAPKTVSLIDVSTYLPGSPIGADYYLQFQAQGPDSDDLRDIRAGHETGPQSVGNG